MWGQDQEAAFSRLKTALLKVPVVHQPDMDKAFHVSMDTSQHGVGAVLYQVVNGMETITGNGMIAEDQFLGANKTREFIIRSATRKGG